MKITAPVIRSLPWLLAGLIASMVCITNTYHRFYPLSLRDHLPVQTEPYAATLQRLDAERPVLPDREFTRLATGAYLAASAYEWPESLTRISPQDNWILWLAAWVDPLLHRLGLQEPQTRVFGQFESFRYERAMGRGFGICSQQSLGLADLMTRRYDIPARMIGLDGHVVVELTLEDGSKQIADPSVGIVLPFGFEAIEANRSAIERAYAGIARADLAATYDAKGNILASAIGGRAYSPEAYKQELVRIFEIMADYLSVLISLAVACIAFYRFSQAVRLRYRSDNTEILHNP